jgi:molybdenum cofactor cytidylyltransferase
MGLVKQLLPLGHKPIIRHCIDTLIEAKIGEIAVVISSCGHGLGEHLRGLPVIVAVNENPGSDMAESVRSGLRRLKNFSSAVLVCLCDHPLVAAETIRTLVREHGRFPGNIIIPEFHGKRGHPSLFPRHMIDEIFSTKTLRDIVKEDPARVRLVPVRDEGVVLDMDEPGDYTAILKRYLSK